LSVWFPFRVRYDYIVFGDVDSIAAHPNHFGVWRELKELFVKLTLVMASVLALFSLPALADENPAGSAPKTDAPAEHRVLAVVGGTEITVEQLSRVLSKIEDLQSKTAEERAQVEQMILRGLIAQATVHKMLEKENVQCSEAELAAFCKTKYGKKAEKAKVSVEQYIKDNKIPQNEIIDQANLYKIMTEAGTTEKVAAFIKDNPDYFNGTKVHACHILIRSDPMDSTEAQLAARKKIEAIAARIQDGKVSFEDAARSDSDDTDTRKDGGDLGESTFGKMVVARNIVLGFSQAAFKLKKGETSPVIHTEVGFHLIKIIDRTPGSEPQDPLAQKLAQAVLRNQIENRVMEMTISGDCPIQIKK
jgi:parvulin-like peptidyl-prolyl isomerase